MQHPTTDVYLPFSSTLKVGNYPKISQVSMVQLLTLFNIFFYWPNILKLNVN